MSVKAALEQKLKSELKPQYLEVHNESYMHRVPEGSESHFRFVIVSEAFEGLMSLKRHRLVNDLLKEELKSVRAFSVQPFTPAEWKNKQEEVLRSPACMGARKEDE